MAKKLGKEPAFASRATYGINHYKQIGMSKRFYAACFAMQGLIASGVLNKTGITGHKTAILISDSYFLADELLKQENDN